MKYVWAFVCLFLSTTLFAQKLSPVEKNGGYIFELDGRNVSDVQYEDYKATYFKYYLVKKDGKWGIIDQKGKEAVACKYDTLYRAWSQSILAEVEGKIGAIDTLGNIIIPLEYEAIDHVGGDDYVGLVKKEGKWGKLLSDGTIDYASDLVFHFPERLPLFKFCKQYKKDYSQLKNCADSKLMEHIYKTVKYPYKARLNGTEGIVVVSFVIQADGKVADVKIRRDPGDGCGLEAKRIVDEFKKWIPATQDGKKVACRLNLPVRFKLN